MRTLVIQLGRLGDVIQTTPLLLDLAATLGEDPVDLLLVHPNQSAIFGMRGVATIRTVNEDLKSLDNQIATGFRQRRIPMRARTLLEQLNLPRYDRVINASHAALGCWLAGQIASAERHGGAITPEGECLYQGAAQTYRIALLGFREQNWFNVVDLMRGAAPARQSSTQGSPATSRLYVNESVALPFALPPGRKVALNVGASETGRTWPAAHFARLAERLAAQGLAPILVGAPSDREACAAVQAASRTALPSFAGKTSIPEMARLLRQSELLVSADTGAAHMAAAVGTTVLGLYGATAYFAETAPWGAGHLILQTRIGVAMSALPVDAVLAAALNRLGRLDAVRLHRELTQSGQAAWETAFLPDNADPLGGLCYRPLHRRSLDITELFTRALRHVFAREFCGGVGRVSLDYLRDFSSMAGADEEVYDARVARLDSGLWQNSESLAQVLEQMEEGATACAMTSTLRDSRSRIGLDVAKLTNALEALKSLTESAELTMFRPVVHYLDWRLRMMPVLPPKETFTSHALEYRAAARLLREATRLLSDALEGSQDCRNPYIMATTTATTNRDWGRIAV